MAIGNIAKKGRVQQVTITEPYEDVKALYRTALTMKELVEVLAGQRGQALDAAVTWQDLLNLQLVRYEEIPYDIGTTRFGPQG